MRIERTDQGELDKIVSAPQEQGVATPLRSASVSGGQTRFNGTSSLIVNGSEDVYGTLNVQGTLNADGTVNLTATISVTGNLTVSGPSRFEGSLTVNGPSGFTGQETHIGDESHQGTLTYLGNEKHSGNIENTGTTTQKGDLNVTDGGKVNVATSGQIVVAGPTPLQIANGAITAGGAELSFVSGVGMSMEYGSSKVIVTPFGATLTGGSASVSTGVLGTVNISGDVYMPDLPTKP